MTSHFATTLLGLFFAAPAAVLALPGVASVTTTTCGNGPTLYPVHATFSAQDPESWALIFRGEEEDFTCDGVNAMTDAMWTAGYKIGDTCNAPCTYYNVHGQELRDHMPLNLISDQAGEQGSLSYDIDNGGTTITVKIGGFQDITARDKQQIGRLMICPIEAHWTVKGKNDWKPCKLKNS